MIAENIARVRTRIALTATRTGRDPSKICLMAATKSASVPQIVDAICAGIELVGENYIQTAVEKFSSLPPVEKHFIGSLQRNKVGSAVQHFDCIQSVDGLPLAKEIDMRAREQNKVMPIFIEINPGEESKGGVSFSEAGMLYNSIVKLQHLKVRGLMGIAPLHGDARSFFQKMNALKDELGVKELSMGMSDDFEIAIEEGSTMVRVGRAIFNG